MKKMNPLWVKLPQMQGGCIVEHIDTDLLCFYLDHK